MERHATPRDAARRKGGGGSRAKGRAVRGIRRGSQRCALAAVLCGFYARRKGLTAFTVAIWYKVNNVLFTYDTRMIFRAACDVIRKKGLLCRVTIPAIQVGPFVERCERRVRRTEIEHF